MKKLLVLLLIAALLISGARLLKKRRQSIANAPTPAPLALQVEIVSPKTEQIQQTRPVLARLSSLNSARISSKLSGLITALLVRENQSVKKGDMLLQIDDLEIKSSIKSLQSNMKAQEKEVKYARNLHERNKALFKVGGLAREKYEASGVAYAGGKANLEATRQKITALKVQLSYLNIRAPFDGTVGTIFLRMGDLASPGKPLLSINSPEQKLTFSYVPGNITVKTGQKIFRENMEIGQVTRLYSDADKGLSVAEAAVDRTIDLPNNSYLTVDLLVFRGKGCTVPINSLLRLKKESRVMIHENGIFSPFQVNIIAEDENLALIDPCPVSPVAIGTAARLSQLPAYGKVLVHGSKAHE
ncbi:MAG: efflux RND transporter periplasmic adaptor subunit [Deltaproteobacteria bacterium]|nr:efflux RND transporter periplasmic adaptor subunit [Deltaproteobacteria bacterium]